MSKTKIRNNTARVWTLGNKNILPGATEDFTDEELAPFDNSKVLKFHFDRKDLELITPASEPEPEENLTQPPKPGDQIGEKEAVKVEDPAALAKLLQSGAPSAVNVAAEVKAK